jgi:hypothetical protein
VHLPNNNNNNNNNDADDDDDDKNSNKSIGICVLEGGERGSKKSKEEA